MAIVSVPIVGKAVGVIYLRKRSDVVHLDDMDRKAIAFGVLLSYSIKG